MGPGQARLLNLRLWAGRSRTPPDEFNGIVTAKVELNEGPSSRPRRGRWPKPIGNCNRRASR